MTILSWAQLGAAIGAPGSAGWQRLCAWKHAGSETGGPLSSHWHRANVKLCTSC